MPLDLESNLFFSVVLNIKHNMVFRTIRLYEQYLELVSKELNHFGVIADLFRQVGGHSSRFVLFCSF
jgi:hypothetical protein